MKEKLLKCALLACIVAALTGEKPMPMRLDVTGRPEGAKVYVDGTFRGNLRDGSACTVTPLDAGRHRLHVAAPHYRPFDAYVRLDESNGFMTKAVELEPECGIVLVKSKPDGATVTCRGNALGTTPLLITTLPCGPVHVLELSLNGYKRKRVEVCTTDRTPLVRDEALVLDSGIAYCTSEPAGATVSVDGIEQGTTPVEVMVPRGGAVLTFRLDGYKAVEQSVGMSAGERRQVAVKMEGQPARLTVVTEPEKAKVYLDGNFQGKSPVTVDAVKSGAHEIRAELPGYATARRTVELSIGGETTETLVLESILGRIKVDTEPSGARVSLDGRHKGTTGYGESHILTIADVEVGEHTVEVYLDGYLPQSKTVTVTAKETKQLPFTLKRDTTPDTDVEMRDGSHVKGLFKKQDKKYIFLEMPNGTERPIPRENIRRAMDLKMGIDISSPGASIRLVTDPAK